MNYEKRYRIFLLGTKLLSVFCPPFLAYRIAARWGRWFSPRKGELGLVRERLALCFPGNQALVEVACRYYLENAAINALNSYFYRQMSPGWLVRRIRVVDDQHLHTAIAEGKGVLVLAAHQHHLVMLGVVLGLMGLRVNPILLDPKLTVPPYLEDYMGRAIRDSESHYHGGQYLMVDLSSNYVRKLYRLFDAGEIVVSANDFPRDLAPKRRLSFPFLGQQLSCAAGSVEVALSRGATIVSAFIFWQGADRFELRFAPIETEAGVAGVMAQYASQLEAAVVRDPAGWEGWKWGQLFL
jgi:lauroyl/myristoyl acyltransferase